MPLDIRVIYGDTDQMGVVYYANYLRYFEAARGAFIRDQGQSYGDVEKLGFALPVIEAHVRYRQAARYDDLLRIEATVTQVRAASMRFDYRLHRDHELLADGYTVHACVDKSGRPVRFPQEMKRLLGEKSIP
jgi:acyl-CoA thioester hydrolase